MTGSRNQKSIPFNKLHFHLQRDPYYGIQTEVEELEGSKGTPQGDGPADSVSDQIVHHGDDCEGIRSMVRDLHEEFTGMEIFEHFGLAYEMLPCKRDSQRYVLLIWCALMGLPAFRGGRQLHWDPRDFLHHWKGDFEIRISDLSEFLRTNHWPLPFSLFPTEIDNTKNKRQWADEEYELAVYQVNQTLPQLKRELRDLSGSAPERFSEVQEKNRWMLRLKQEIRKIEEQYCLAKSPSANLPTTKRGLEGLKRNQELQRQAEVLAEKLKRQGEQSVTRRKIAVQLSKDPNLKVTAATIERILKKNW